MRFVLLIFVFSLGWGIGASPAAQPQLLIWEWSQLQRTKAAMDNAGPELEQAFKTLHKEADRALRVESHSVTYNEFVPPSGDKHDYASFGAYWWPDPSKPDGLPYIRRDGQTNEAQKSLGDKNVLNYFVKDVVTLSLAYYYFEDEKYAQHATGLIRDWYLNPATRMNPHLEYAQAVLGRNHGKNSGVIDTRDFMLVLESVELLKKSTSYNTELENGLKQWFTEFLRWLQTSKLGQKEAAARNNHGSWHHAQAMRIALFLEDQSTAQELFKNVRENLIPTQIMPDGSQPEELARTNAFHYSIFNLHALAMVARMGEALDADLWHYETADGRGMPVAAAYLLPYVKGKTDWPHEQITKYRISPLTNQFLRMLSVRYEEPGWLEVADKYFEGTTKYDYSLFLAEAYQEKLAASK